MTEWLKRLPEIAWESIVGNLIWVALVAIVGGLYLMIERPPSPLKLDFQAVRRCPNGILVDIQQRLNPKPSLERGADSMVICDAEVLWTTKANGPADLAKRFRGCLRYLDGTLSMLRASPAVCALPDQKGYLCDGASARNYPGSDSFGVDGASIPICSDQRLRKFGFVD
ncbi:hypothetical protein [Mesorhizobium salmacidum]|uniref:Uncharacterized protein n=1 Tax=Mesorhizobium salmacidum TaxID=3015171 RepID=A0ABU8KW53_9HYPH